MVQTSGLGLKTSSTTRVCWEQRGLSAMVGLSLSEPGGPQGKSQSREGGLSRTVKKFSHSQTYKQSCTGQRKGPLSTKETEGGRERGGISNSYNNTAHRSIPYAISLPKRSLMVNAPYRQTLFCEQYAVEFKIFPGIFNLQVTLSKLYLRGLVWASTRSFG